MRTRRVDVALAAPSVDDSWANCRAASQFSGPCPASALARSPNIGMLPNGLLSLLGIARSVIGHATMLRAIAAVSVASRDARCW